MLTHKRAFTGIALTGIVAVLFNIGIVGGLVWAAVHFIRKFW